jgi:hypothetical protein
MRLRDVLLVAAGFAALLLFSGCDEISVAGLDPASTPDRPAFLLGKDESFRGAAKIYGCGIDGRPRDFSGPDSSTMWHAFWDIEADSGLRYVEVPHIAMGDTPTHFHTTVPAETLPAGWLYEFHAGFHGLGNQVYFEIQADSTGARVLRSMTEDEFLAVVHPGGGK